MIVFVSSPYGGKQENYEKACEYCALEIMRGNVPIAPHVMYHNVLSEENDRQTGLDAGLELLSVCEEMHVYGADIKDATPGMVIEIEHALNNGKPILFMEG